MKTSPQQISDSSQTSNGVNNYFAKLSSWSKTLTGRIVLSGVGLIAILAVVVFNQQLASLFSFNGSHANTGHVILVDGTEGSLHPFFEEGSKREPDDSCFVVDTGTRHLMLNSTCTQPNIASITPDQGPAGQLVTITGTNFGDSAIPNKSKVEVGNKPAAIVSWTDTAITITTPAQTTVGKMVVKVTVPGGADSQIDGYTYNHAPGINLIHDFNIGPAGTTVNIEGANFISGAGLQVKFGSTLATDVQFVDAGHLRVTSPSGEPGVVSITVVNPDGQVSYDVPFDHYTYTP